MTTVTAGCNVPPILQQFFSCTPKHHANLTSITSINFSLVCHGNEMAFYVQYVVNTGGTVELRPSLAHGILAYTYTGNAVNYMKISLQITFVLA